MATKEVENFAVRRKRVCTRPASDGEPHEFTSVESRFEEPSFDVTHAGQDGNAVRETFSPERLERSIIDVLTYNKSDSQSALAEEVRLEVERRARNRLDEGAITHEELAKITLEVLRSNPEVYASSRIRYAFGVANLRPHARAGFADLNDLERWLRETWSGDPHVRPAQRLVRKRDIGRGHHARRPPEGWQLIKLRRSLELATNGISSREERWAIIEECCQQVDAALGSQTLVTSEQIANEVLRYLRSAQPARPLTYLRYASATKRLASANEVLNELIDLRADLADQPPTPGS